MSEEIPEATELDPSDPLPIKPDMPDASPLCMYSHLNQTVFNNFIIMYRGSQFQATYTILSIHLYWSKSFTDLKILFRDPKRLGPGPSFVVLPDI